MSFLHPLASAAGFGVVKIVDVTDHIAEATFRRGAASGYPSLNASSEVEQIPADAELKAIAGLVSAADRLPYFTGLGAAALATFTAAGRAIVDDASAADQRTTPVLGTPVSPTSPGLSLDVNLFVSGSKTYISGENTAFADSFLFLNDNYTADAAQTVGLAANYDPTTTADTVAGSYTASTVVTTGAATFAAGDIILVNGSANNDGPFEVGSHGGTTLT